MNRKVFETMYNSIPLDAIAHIKTTAGDKLCIKDNKNSTKAGITCIIHDFFVEIKCISVAEKTKKIQATMLPYSSILLVEHASNIKTENDEEKEKE